MVVNLMSAFEKFLGQHDRVTRRYFLRWGAAATAVGLSSVPSLAQASSPALAEAMSKLESFLTMPDQFRDVSRGKPLPHSLAEDRKKEAGLTRDAWRLEVTADPDHPTRIGQPLTKAAGTALDFASLMQIAEKRAVRFIKTMTCLNIGCPLGTGLWEGVPLRDIVWKTEPREDLRRVFYYGYHNDDPQQMFRSSLPIGRVLEDYYDLPPVILCYKLNGQWLSPERGGPVRIIVPEGYGFKSIKWLTHVVLTNLPHANDTYAEQNNDIDSPLKTFAATITVPREVKAGQPIPITGYAQCGISGLAKVQVWIHSDAEEWPVKDRYFTSAPWIDAEILPPPKIWGGGLANDAVPPDTHGLDPQGRPRVWPMRLCKVHWAVLLPGLPAGEYTLRSRTIDEKGSAQPMPRPFRKSGQAEIEQVSLIVKS